MKKEFIIAACLLLSGMSAHAQGIIVNKTDGTKVYYAAEEVESITTYGYGEELTTGEAIDLGLPSGIKWANMNVGASKPEDYGGYYAWGETEEKDYYHWSTYIHYYSTWDTYPWRGLGSNISGNPDYDVARKKWGGKWRMPTFYDIEELLNNCTYEWTEQNGVNGGKFTGPNGNSIFLPAAGSRWEDGLNNEGSSGGYWSGTGGLGGTDYSDSVYCLYFRDGSRGWSTAGRVGGLSVRPVTE